MDETHTFLAIDLGASNGRVVLGRMKDRRLSLDVVHRFEHALRFVDGHKRWDWPRFRSGIRQGLAMAVERPGAGPVVSVSCDAWAQDFGLLDAGGELVYPPVSYRDARSERFPEGYFDRLRAEELVSRVGVGAVPVTALCQLYAMARQEPGVLANAAGLLHVADLVHYDLCGVAATDWTLATASQLRNLETGDWDRELLDLMGIPHRMLPGMVDAPQVLGRIPADRAPHPKLAGVPVVISAGHDTAAASAASGPLDEEAVFLSAGTYAMPGCVFDAPVVPPGAVEAGCALVGLAGHRWGLFTSAMGMWMIQECCRLWEREGERPSYEELVRLAENAATEGTISLSDSRFHAPEDMREEIRRVCAQAGVRPPETRGEFARLIFDSMIREHREAIFALGKLAGRRFERVRVVSGGSRNAYFCRDLAGALGIPVLAGPAEATAAGNVLLQARAMGVLDEDGMNEVSCVSFPRTVYRLERASDAVVSTNESRRR